MACAPGTFAYPGSKTSIAGWVLDHIPDHHLYVEPFGGAASILVAKPRSEVEVYNDINGDCVSFFEAVRDSPDELQRWVKHTPYSRELFDKYVDRYPDWPDDSVERAGRFLFIQSVCFGGKGLNSDSRTPTYAVSKSSTPWIHCGEYKWTKKAEQIPKVARRFQGVNIEQLDYADLVEKYDDSDAFFYFDPPYVDVGDAYYQTEEGGFDHSRFVNTLHDMDAKWLVSYDQNLPPGLEDYHTVSRTKKATLSGQNPEKVETVTMNYDMSGERVMSDYGQQTLDGIAD